MFVTTVHLYINLQNVLYHSTILWLPWLPKGYYMYKRSFPGTIQIYSSVLVSQGYHMPKHLLLLAIYL